MDARSPRGSALLITGHLAEATRHGQPSLQQCIGRVGDALLAGGTGWSVTRLDPSASANGVPTRRNVDRALRALQDSRSDVAMIVVGGSVATVDGEPALVADAQWSESASSAAAMIPLTALRARSSARHMVIVLGGSVADGVSRGDPSARWLSALSRGEGDLVAVSAGEQAARVIEALEAALTGSAVDDATGTVTLRSLGDYLASQVPGLAIHATPQLDTVVVPPPLTGPWDPRLTLRSRHAGERLRSAPRTLCGTTLPGRFRIEAELARGGFGTVYRARQLTIDRDVAVKVLHTEVDPASPSGRLFVQEIHGVGRIDHPNVVRIHHADVTRDGQLFFAMELLAGRDLEQVIQAEGRMSERRALGLIGQLLAGLGAAHEAGLVHADVKPANVVVVPGRRDDRVVLVDFGLARLQTTDAPTRSVGGTPAYMAPEQLSSGRVDARSDLFAAALVLITLLTGWRRRTRDELIPPLDDVTNPALRAALDRALALSPEARFRSAAEFAAALADTSPDAAGVPLEDASAETAMALAAGSPVAAHDAPRRRPVRRPAFVALGVLGGLGIMAAAGAAAIAWTRRAEAPPSSTPASPPSIAAEPPRSPSLPSVVIGGSGTLLWGFFAPLNAFLEEVAEVTIPITSQNDLGSGGALSALRAGTLDIAALSRRNQGGADDAGPGKLLVELAIGFDETSLFVWRGNPLRTVDLEAVHDHLCCDRDAEVAALTWRDFGLVTAPLAAQPVTWLVFGRKKHPGPAETTSATLALADEWLCAPRRLCSSSITFDAQANDVLPTLVKDTGSFALSSRSFATDQVAAVTLVDRTHHVRLDGRKVLWIYALVDRSRPVPAKLCRFFGAVLDPAVEGRLAATGKATGLTDPLRRRQRTTLGLDDGACDRVPAGALAERAGNALTDTRLASPIADDVEVKTRWVPYP
jgi:hypothetical protein